MRYTVEEIKVKDKEGDTTLVHAAATLRIQIIRSLVMLPPSVFRQQTGGEILTKWELLEYLLLVCLAQFKARPRWARHRIQTGALVGARESDQVSVYSKVCISILVEDEQSDEEGYCAGRFWKPS